MTSANRLETIIAKVVKDPQLHARWLNTFSFLEYVGFRKIVKSQRAEGLTSMVLTHALEEGRHALRLKKLALALGGASFDSYAPEKLLCGDEAEDYFQDLDHETEAQFEAFDEGRRAKLTYLYVTWLIERRALDLYGLYRNAVDGTEIAQRLTGLLAEEDGHLQHVEAEIAASDPEHAARTPQLVALENRLYERFLGALTKALGVEAAAA